MSNQFLALLEKQKPDIQKMLASWITPERFFAMAMQLEKNPELKNCTPESLVECVMQAATAGLEIGGTRGHCYVVKYGDKATLMVGWRGLAFLKLRGGAIIQIDTDVVCEGDDFMVGRGTDGDIFRHVIDYKVDRKEENAYCAYALVKLANNDIQFEVLTKERIMRHRRHSKNPNGLLWTTFWEEGWRKTPWRVLDKRLPEGMHKEAVERYSTAITLDAKSYQSQDTDLGIGPDDEHRAPDMPRAIEVVDDREDFIKPKPKTPKAKAEAPKPPSEPKQEARQPEPPPPPPEPEKPKVEDRLLNVDEQDELLGLWTSGGKKHSQLAGWLQNRVGVSDPAQVKVSQFPTLREQMADA